MKRRNFLRATSVLPFLTNSLYAAELTAGSNPKNLFQNQPADKRDFFYKPADAWAADFIPLYASELLFFLMGYIIFFAFSTGAVIWVLISEVFPNSVHGQGQSLGSFTHWFFAAVITFLFPVVAGESESGSGHIFLFFCIMMILQAIVVWKFFPETKEKTLEQLEDELSGSVKHAVVV